MYCSQCGKENANTAKFCSACGNQFSAHSESVDRSTQHEQEFKKISVLLMIFFTSITVGIYNFAWFLKRQNTINNLQSKEKLNSGVLFFAIAVFSTSLLFSFASSVGQAFIKRDPSELLELFVLLLKLFSNILVLIALIIEVVQSFKVRRIFNEHFNIHLNKNIRFSGLATFFFNIYYLQYKINRF